MDFFIRKVQELGPPEISFTSTSTKKSKPSLYSQKSSTCQQIKMNTDTNTTNNERKINVKKIQ